MYLEELGLIFSDFEKSMNHIYWQSGSPVITDTGNENIIRQR